MQLVVFLALFLLLVNTGLGTFFLNMFLYLITVCAVSWIILCIIVAWTSGKFVELCK